MCTNAPRQQGGYCDNLDKNSHDNKAVLFAKIVHLFDYSEKYFPL